MATTITREQIRDRLDRQLPMTLIEALPPRYYEAEHLPGALNIPHDEIRVKAASMLPDKNAFLVVYCASTECQNSRIAANTLRLMGYAHVLEYVEGKQHWMEANLPVESLDTVI